MMSLRIYLRNTVYPPQRPCVSVLHIHYSLPADCRRTYSAATRRVRRIVEKKFVSQLYGSIIQMYIIIMLYAYNTNVLHTRTNNNIANT